jgi:hypothetical protein
MSTGLQTVDTSTEQRTWAFSIRPAVPEYFLCVPTVNDPFLRSAVSSITRTASRSPRCSIAQSRTSSRRPSLVPDRLGQKPLRTSRPALTGMLSQGPTIHPRQTRHHPDYKLPQPLSRLHLSHPGTDPSQHLIQSRQPPLRVYTTTRGYRQFIWRPHNQDYLRWPPPSLRRPTQKITICRCSTKSLFWKSPPTAAHPVGTPRRGLPKQALTPALRDRPRNAAPLIAGLRRAAPGHRRRSAPRLRRSSGR